MLDRVTWRRGTYRLWAVLTAVWITAIAISGASAINRLPTEEAILEQLAAPLQAALQGCGVPCELAPMSSNFTNPADLTKFQTDALAAIDRGTDLFQRELAKARAEERAIQAKQAATPRPQNLVELE